MLLDGDGRVGVDGSGADEAVLDERDREQARQLVGEGAPAAAGVPTGMLFVRSLNGGVSHSPDELSSPEDIARGIDVLGDALVRIAS